MIVTQYKIKLPSDYDINIIRSRVKNNGHKTDGFDDLKFKMYLVTEKGVNHNIENSYSPLYLWKGNDGLNKFLFGGFYDNILSSFGWHPIHIGIPLMDTTTENIIESKYLLQIAGKIDPQNSLNNLQDQLRKSIPKIGDAEYLVSYNPEKWEYEANYFLRDTHGVKAELGGVVYQILHISQ